MGQDGCYLLAERREVLCSVGRFFKFFVVSCEFEVLREVVVEFLIGSSFVLSFSRKYIGIEVRPCEFRVDSFVWPDFFLNGLGLDSPA